MASTDPSVPPAPLGAPTPAVRYRVQFTADQAYVDLFERARDLLWHQLPHVGLAEIQRLALEALVEKLMSRKCGSASPKATPAARGAAPARMQPESHADEAARSNLPSATAPARTESRDAAPTALARTGALAAAAPARTASPVDTAVPARSSSLDLMQEDSGTAAPASPASRHIPAAVRRQVWQRDGGRCTFSDSRGVRCRATRGIEFHHEHPHALGGPHCADNIALRCRAHNELAAERDFGREKVLGIKRRGYCV